MTETLSAIVAYSVRCCGIGDLRFSGDCGSISGFLGIVGYGRDSASFAVGPGSCRDCESVTRTSPYFPIGPALPSSSRWISLGRGQFDTSVSHPDGTTL